MFKTFKISFKLKNTYRVNTILYGLKQIFLLKKLLPSNLYQNRSLKIIANILAVISEFFSAFSGKILYFIFMIMLPIGWLKPDVSMEEQAFLNILICLSVIGSLLNTYMFNPTKDKYYALILLNMNAKEYTLVNYFYSIIKILIGFGVLDTIYGLLYKFNWYVIVLIPFFVASIKLSIAAFDLLKYKRGGKNPNENKLSKFVWLIVALFLILAYLPVKLGYLLPNYFYVGIMITFILLGILSINVIVKFKDYRKLYKAILYESMSTIKSDGLNEILIEQSRNNIVNESGISSDKKGFHFLNELFIKRHRKILWKTSKYISIIIMVVIIITIALLMMFPSAKNNNILNSVSYLAFIMYSINRGSEFTRALFVNCDHSLLTYSFYKKPRYILDLFKIRLIEIIKINLMPAVLIGIGMCLIVYVSGGTSILNYMLCFMSVTSISVFFSIHYLIMYYLIQPYNINTEVKSGVYKIVMGLTYIFCYFLLKAKLSMLVFGTLSIIFSITYSLIGLIIIYNMAPKTFKIRN